MKVIVCCLLCLMLLLGGCTFLGPSEATSTTTIIGMPEGSYFDVVWLSDTKVVYLYSTSYDVGAWDREILLYDLERGETVSLAKPSVETCPRAELYEIERKSTTQFSALFDCAKKENAYRAEFTLWIMDIETETWDDIKAYPLMLYARDVAFNPNDNTWIQTDDASAMKGTLTYEDAEGMSTPILPTFGRVKSATFKPDGSQIAFLGTEKLPGSEPNIFAGAVSIAETLYYPWSVYTTKDNFESHEVLVSGLITPNTLRWSPRSDYVAWVGSYQRQEGVFRVDPESKKVEIVWRGNAQYDWSPDGERMIVIPLGEEFAASQFVIVDFE